MRGNESLCRSFQPPENITGELDIGWHMGKRPISAGRGKLSKKKPTKRKPKRASRFAAVRGTATVKMSTQEIMTLTRGDD